MATETAPELMQSINFEFLRPHWPELAALGGFAEAYAHADPLGSLAKLRTFCEQLAKDLHQRLRLPRLFRPNLIELLDDSAFKSAVPRVVVTKMHALRVDGNRAVHAGSGDTTTALRVLKDAHELARWLFVTFAGAVVADCPTFADPPVGATHRRDRQHGRRPRPAHLPGHLPGHDEVLRDLRRRLLRPGHSR